MTLTTISVRSQMKGRGLAVCFDKENAMTKQLTMSTELNGNCALLEIVNGQIVITN